ncbi:MAG: GNAT family N-acetyltransferase [Planctomycetota bacterium]|nr:GNAT family N-acetyltransferase [Planctomycetota bacterium]
MADDIKIHEIHELDQFPSWLTPAGLSEYLHESLKPFDDPASEVLDGINAAFKERDGHKGFILVAEHDEKPVGALVMIRTGMKGYIPENVLLYVAVSPSMRGKGIGTKLIERSYKITHGNIKLHVEYENPAKKLYEKLGFVSKYAEMRYNK